jgi:8-oxo-dGTP pyrophosphatase MutT (NUDIX family)
MFSILLQQLQRHPLATPAPRLAMRNAAVLVALHGSESDPQVILTERAAHLNSHPGEVAFPGGMFEGQDEHLLETALRETVEEIGLCREQIKPLATLPAATPKRSEVLVTPFVARIEEPLQFTLEKSELSAVFSVPLSHFISPQRYRYFDVDVRGSALTFPCIDFAGYRIWGFTLRVIVEMLNDCLAANIVLRYPAQYLQQRPVSLIETR